MTLLRALAVLFLVLLPGPITAATLLPNGEQQFLDNSGKPLAGGKVYFYTPNTTSPKNTYQNSGATILNTNPVILDAGGRSIIYGNGAYRQVVKDALGNLIYDQLTADGASAQISYGGATSGTANAQSVTAANFSSGDGQIIVIKPSFSNTGPTTLNVNATGALGVYKDTAAGPVNLTGGELTGGGEFILIYDAGLGAFHVLNDKFSNIATASVLGLVKVGANLSVAGDGTISTTAAVFTGEVRSFAVQTCPTGWLEANGQTVTRVSALGAAIGTAFGVGDGSTTTNIPDMRGYAMRGWDHGRGVDPGRTFGSYQQDLLKDHDHTLNFSLPLISLSAGGIATYITNGPDTYTATGTVRGGLAGTETRMKNIAFLYCIKT